MKARVSGTLLVLSMAVAPALSPAWGTSAPGVHVTTIRPSTLITVGDLAADSRRCVIGRSGNRDRTALSETQVLMTFDIGRIPPEAIIERAILRLKSVGGGGRPPGGMDFHRITEPWEKSGIDPGTLPAVEEDPVYQVRRRSDYPPDLTLLFRRWHERPYDNHGILWKAPPPGEWEGGGSLLFEADSILVEVTYAIGDVQAGSAEPSYQGRVLSEWVSDLGSEDPLVRLEALDAIRVIGPAGGDTSVRAVLGAFDDGEEKVRRQAAATLGAIALKSPTAIQGLGNALRHDDPRVAGMAAEALRGLGPEATPVIPDLVQALRADESEVRRWSALALAEIGPPARKAVPTLTRCLEDEGIEVRVAAAMALGAIGCAAAPAITALEAARAPHDHQLASHVQAMARESVRRIRQCQDNMSRLAQDCQGILVRAQAYFHQPREEGGGGGSFEGLTPEVLGVPSANENTDVNGFVLTVVNEHTIKLEAGGREPGAYVWMRYDEDVGVLESNVD